VYFSVSKLILVGLAVVLAHEWIPSAQAGMHSARLAEVPAIVARVLPAVVSITTRRIETDQFNKPMPKAGMGSGVIVDRQGHILTNSHVVEGADEIKVTLTDGRAFRAAVVGSDRFTDLAVLRIEGKDLKALRLGDSSRVRIGETVIGIGYPLWLEGGATVTVGVVSGKGRSMEEPDDPDETALHDLFQTDAAINPGNSGGPLLNLKGDVIGINTANMPAAHGIGFAIPINNAKSVIATLLAHGRLVRPSLGIAAVSVTPQLAFSNNLRVERGVLVVKVKAGGPGEAAGLTPEDIIAQFEGSRVEDLHQLHGLLWRRNPGDRVRLLVRRGDQEIEVTVTLAEEK